MNNSVIAKCNKEIESKLKNIKLIPRNYHCCQDELLLGNDSITGVEFFSLEWKLARLVDPLDEIVTISTHKFANSAVRYVVMWCHGERRVANMHGARFFV